VKGATHKCDSCDLISIDKEADKFITFVPGVNAICHEHLDKIGTNFHRIISQDEYESILIMEELFR
jgi:hypothetical protein